MIIYLNPLDALGAPPPTEVNIVDTSGQKFLDRLGLLALLGLVMLWRASFNKILSVIFSIMLTAMVLPERFCVRTSFIIAIDLFLVASVNFEVAF